MLLFSSNSTVSSDELLPNADIDRISIAIYSAWWSQGRYIWDILGVISHCRCSYEYF